ncbi:MAG: 1-acyl-sn-glycerol-3-phosphate acyltransferase [Symploca sp. SIO1C4]|uniref:1-acyl-sn-glycerol-3-phosphate acyltransferase n=1 Tax=Symploca sp. SIO1C4 TaxID=2607765 RepID=A0A6B3NBQ8_9CYAN|nr:1-acyl-sn-glycerol-3-phosphate acyltransferase [Symploca sp. SIO1C4]
MFRIQPPLEFIPPKFNPLVLRLVHLSLPLLLRVRLLRGLPVGITRLETKNVEVLVELYRQFQAGKIRFLIAFRHCEADDPLCGLYLLSKAVPQVAHQQGIALQTPIHAHCLYDRGIPLWTKHWFGWLLSCLGAIPVRRGRRLDWAGMRTARELFINGKLPMALAPEGATNGHSEIVSPLESGVAQLGFWCVEDLIKAKRSEQVFIVPIGIKYRYLKPSWRKLDWLLSQLEVDSGLPVKPLPGKYVGIDKETFYYQRLRRLGEHLLSTMEKFYSQYYDQKLPKAIAIDGDKSVSPEEVITTRLQAVLNGALQVAEEYFGLPGKGTVIKRCRQLEEASWTYIYREDWSQLHNSSVMERSLADWIVQETICRIQHMRLVESFVAVTGDYILEKPTFERFAETALILFDLIAHIKNTSKIPRRPRLGQRCAKLTVGEPILLNDRFGDYQENRQAAKQEITNLTQDLHRALEQMIS